MKTTLLWSAAHKYLKKTKSEGAVFFCSCNLRSSPQTDGNWAVAKNELV